MNRFKHWMIGAVLAALATTPALAADLQDPAQLEAFVDGVVEPLMAANSSPSGTVAIVQDGELLLARGYGHEDIEGQVPVDPFQTLFRPGSTSKLFTWVAVMQLEEQGLLDLDANVNDYLEDFQIEDTFAEPITLWNILTHTPGFEDGALGYLIVDDPDKAVSLSEGMKRYQPARVNPPGEQTAYSNYATALAGLIVERVSGVPFNDYVRENIFEPLGMNNSSFVEPLPEDLAARMATSYGLEAGDFKEEPFEIIASFAPAGALSSTATDMVKFGQAILNGGELNGNRILRAETVDRMLSTQFTHDDRLLGMGLGFYAGDYNGYEVWGHGGDTQWFHSYLGIDRENNLTFFSSFGGSGGSAVRTLFAPSLYNEFYPREEAPPEPPENFAERAGKYAGAYGFWRSNFSTIEKAFGLGGGVMVAPTENNTLVVMLGGKAKQYAEVEENLFRQMSPNVPLLSTYIPRQIAFQENEAGEITGFIIDGLPFMSLRKLPAYATSNFNFTLLGLSMVVFLFVLLRRFYQRKGIRHLSADNRSAIKAAVWASAANWITLVSGAVVLTAVADDIFSGIPLAMKIWLVMPIIASLAGLYLLYKMLVVWLKGLLGGVLARLRYTVVALCGLFMCWFYWFWNILGWQYM